MWIGVRIGRLSFVLGWMPILVGTLVFALASASVGENRGLGTKDASLDDWFEKPHSVRNQMPVAGEEVSILRTWKIKKGTYDEFYRRSEEEIWPFFEKIGARIVGMWRVDPVAIDPTRPSAARDYDEVVLLTRYASLDHWRASRSGIALGGNGPDAEALAAAHRYRQSVTIETTFIVLRGSPADNGPYFMPAAPDAP